MSLPSTASLPVNGLPKLARRWTCPQTGRWQAGPPILSARLGLPVSLRDLGIERSCLADIAAKAEKDHLSATNPRPAMRGLRNTSRRRLARDRRQAEGETGAQSGMDADIVIVGAAPWAPALPSTLRFTACRWSSLNAASKFSGYPERPNLTPRTGEHFGAGVITDAIRAALAPIPSRWQRRHRDIWHLPRSDYHHEWFNRAKIVDYYAATE